MLSWLFPTSSWSLHNPLKAWSVHALSERELKIVIQTLSTAEINLCMIWKDGWPDWRKLRDPEFSHLMSMDKDFAFSVPEIPNHILHSHEDEVTTIRLESKDPIKKRSDRRHTRHDIIVPVELVQAGQSFRTETLDVSESGIRFKDNIPEWVAGYFTVIFRVDPVSFEVVCALVEDQKDAKDKAEVVDTKDEESGLQRYLDWIKSLDQKVAK